MTVRQTVAEADQAAVERAKGPTLAQVAQQSIDRQAAMLDAILPSTVDRRRFAQMTIQAVRQAPDLARCFATKDGAGSFLLAVGQAAMVGLEPNTPTQECWILPRKRGNVQEAQLTIGYRGIMKLARRSGNIRTIVAEVVRQGDLFDYGYGVEGPYLDWKPADEQGDMTHAFAIAWFKDGGRSQIVLNRAQVESRRAASDSFKARENRHSPWIRWPEAMWRKSAIRALAPFLDLSAEADTVLSRDEAPVRFDPETGVIDVDESYGELEPAEDEVPEPDENGESPAEEASP